MFFDSTSASLHRLLVQNACGAQNNFLISYMAREQLRAISNIVYRSLQSSFVDIIVFCFPQYRVLLSAATWKSRFFVSTYQNISHPFADRSLIIEMDAAKNRQTGYIKCSKYGFSMVAEKKRKLNLWLYFRNIDRKYSSGIPNKVSKIPRCVKIHYSVRILLEFCPNSEFYRKANK